MFIKKIDGPRTVRFADGTVLTRSDLPPEHTTRWVASRKAAIIKALQGGLISRDEALSRWSLSDEELGEWENALANFGECALKVTRTQQYRQP
jgi:hypothetical protein